jgi:integrase
MASISCYGGGLKRIDFFLVPNGPRKFLRLGRVSKKRAESWQTTIEQIIADRQANRPHDSELSTWLGGLDESMLKRLRKLGLVDAGVGLAQTTLGEFLQRFEANMPGKAGTKTFYAHTARNLREHFTESRPVRDISTSDADGWRRWLVEHEKLSTATVGRRVVAARTIWRQAMRWRLAAENPFCGVKAGQQINDSRKQFVTLAAIEKVIEQTPDLEWKVIIALARYGGLRTPSETFALRWGDVNWEAGSLHVTCPKLEHTGHGERTIPLFPELRTHLLNLFHEAPDGAEYVILRQRRDGANLRTHLLRLIERAGLTAWPRLFHNLRASRETELMRNYDLATVCKWIGNSPAIAAQHYAMSTDLNADFQRASGQAQQNAQQKAQQPAVAHDAQQFPNEHETPENAGENEQNNDCGQALETAGKTDQWAIQDSNL